MKGKKKSRSNKSTLSRSKRCTRPALIKEKEDCSISVWSAVYLVLGVVLALYLGHVYVQHTRQLHENELWFSHITELEREISFRTEAALYYSYYKQIVKAPSFIEGFLSLIHDNSTEHGHSINAIHRFNIFQEIILALLYSMTTFQKYSEAIFFYVNSVFILQGVYAVALYFTAWLLSGSIMGGALAFAFFFFNRIDVTRVEYAVSLRESFALPFIALQLFFTTVFLKVSSRSTWPKMFFLLSSLAVALTWQFAQFVFLLEACTLLILYSMQLSSRQKIQSLMHCYIGVLLIVCVLQFLNVIPLTSLVFGITVATTVVFTLLDYADLLRKHATFLVRLLRIPVLFPAAVMVLAVCLSLLTKKLIGTRDGDHIITFILAKLGLYDFSRDFELLLYLCQPAFQSVSRDTLLRLASTLLLPCYLFGVVVLSAGLAHHSWRVFPKSSLIADNSGSSFNTETNISNGTSENNSDSVSSAHVLPQKSYTGLKPPGQTISAEFAYHLLLSAAFGVVAMTTQRFKVLWVPHMCVLAASTLANIAGWRTALKRIGLTMSSDSIGKILHFIGISGLITAIIVKELPAVMSHLSELREFHDRDTVELMQWITVNTRQGAVFGGSMQLLAGVRLCTGRSITNHPHFENKGLRERTKQVYQMYGKWTSEEVYNSLRHYETDYIIIENSICFSGKHNQEICKLVDIMDTVHNDKKTEERFCEGVRYLTKYKERFTLVFENNTFLVYRLT